MTDQAFDLANIAPEALPAPSLQAEDIADELIILARKDLLEWLAYKSPNEEIVFTAKLTKAQLANEVATNTELGQAILRYWVKVISERVIANLKAATI